MGEMTYRTPLILVTAVVVFAGYQKINQGQVLSKTIEVTPTVVPSPTVTPTNTPTFTPTPVPLINLIQNAIQAMPDGGTLRLSLRQAGEAAAIAVQDTGVGIPPEKLTRIFDPFFTTKPDGEGTGLGLSVSYGIVSHHKGRIDVESTVGEGTTFTVLLPTRQSHFTS